MSGVSRKPPHPCRQLREIRLKLDFPLFPSPMIGKGCNHIVRLQYVNLEVDVVDVPFKLKGAVGPRHKLRRRNAIHTKGFDQTGGEMDAIERNRPARIAVPALRKRDKLVEPVQQFLGPRGTDRKAFGIVYHAFSNRNLATVLSNMASRRFCNGRPNRLLGKASGPPAKDCPAIASGGGDRYIGDIGLLEEVLG